jgi:hypothetical protein
MEIRVMNKTLKIAWLMGWAIPKSWFKAHVLEIFPYQRHYFFEPTRDAIKAITTQGPFDITVGYSLGSLLILSANLPKKKTGKVVLLAPIIGFISEMQLGGKITVKQLKHTQKLLKRNPMKTIAEFYSLTGLNPKPSLMKSFSSDQLNTLDYGLKALEEIHITQKISKNVTAICGSADPLLDAIALKLHIPELQVIVGATHEPVSLLISLKALLA